MLEGDIGRASPQSRDVGELVGHDVVIRAVWELGSWSRSAVAFIKVTVVGDVFKIFDEHPIKPTFGTIRSFSRTQSVAGPKPTGFALQVRRIAGTFRTIDGKAIGGVTEQCHGLPWSIDRQIPKQSSGKAVVVIRASALRVGSIHIDSKSDGIRRMKDLELPSA